jgi:DNA polymerase III subunit gamma/tau
MLGMAAELEVNGSLRRTQQPRVLLELLLLRFAWLDRTLELEAMIRALGGEGPPPSAPGHSGSPPLPPPGLSPPGPPTVDPASLHGARPHLLPRPDLRTRRRPPGRAVRRRLRCRCAGHLGAADSNGDSGADSGADVSTAQGGFRRESAEIDVVAAWRELVASGDGLPPGVSPFLLGAQARSVRGGLEVALPAGPALERLRDPEVRERLRDALRVRTGQTEGLTFVELSAEAATGPGGSRISPDAVRRGRMDDLLAREPGLRVAVETLDLEFMDG